MTLRSQLERALSRLKARPGAALQRCRIGAPASADDLALVQQLAGPLPPVLLDLYRQMDGLALGWTLQEPGQAELNGSLDLLPVRAAWLGLSPLADGAPGEGMLWNAAYDAPALRRLQPMRVLESTAGQPVFITVLPGSQPLQLYRVEVQTIQRLWPKAEVCLALLLQHLGCEGVREALAQRGWRRLLDADPRLRRLEQLP